MSRIDRGWQDAGQLNGCPVFVYLPLIFPVAHATLVASSREDGVDVEAWACRKAAQRLPCFCSTGKAVVTTEIRFASPIPAQSAVKGTSGITYLCQGSGTASSKALN